MTMNIKEAKKTHIPKDYQVFAVDEFLGSKTFKIENVRTGKVQGVECIKVDARIIEDKDGYNRGKVITIRIEKEDDNSFESQLNELRTSFGKEIELNDEDIEGIYTHRGNILTIIAVEFTVIEDKERHKLEKPENSDRPLAKINKYYHFEIDEFLNENNLELSGLYNDKGKGYAFFDAFIDSENVIRIGVVVEDVEELPSELLRLHTDFASAVDSYIFDDVSASHYNTRWTLYFESLTFKAGVLGDDTYTIGIADGELIDESSGGNQSADLY